MFVLHSNNIAMNYEEICQKLQQICIKTGDFIYNEGLSFDTSKIEYKGFNDLVSYVDKEAQSQLMAELKALLPEAGFIAEEGHVKENVEGLHWIIDPLDGTTNFLHQLPVFSVSVALADSSDLVVACVYEANRKECFSAIKGKGAFCNDQPIKVSAVGELSKSLIATGFPYYEFGKTDQYLAILKTFMQKTHGLRRLGSAAVDLAYVACGRFEAFYEYNLQPWDVAAGYLLVQEAGGIISDFDGNNKLPLGAETVASCAVHTQVVEVISAHWSKKK